MSRKQAFSARRHVALVLLMAILFSVIGPVAQSWASADRSASRRARMAGVTKERKVRRAKVTPSPTPSTSETPTPAPTPTATPTPTPTPTATPTPTPTPTASATPAPATGHPNLVLTQADVAAIRARIDQRLEPETAALSSLLRGQVANALAATPSVVAGPLASGGVGSQLELAIDRDGQFARDLGLAFALTGDRSYAAKARAYLLAWANGNTPTTYANCGDKWAGSYQAHGAFMFAYAYDLVYDSDVFSAADRTAIETYFRSFVDALDTFNAKVRSEWVITHPDYTQPYQWDPTKTYYVYETYVGSDMVLLQQAARLAMARTIGYTAVVNGILNDSSNILGLQSMAKAALSPRNSGDGVVGHPTPTPHIYVYAQRTAGRGGMFDYMTYNTRVVHVLYEMARNAGWDEAKVTEVEGRLQKTWSYFGRFFGPSAEPNFNPTDVINYTACVPRFALAYRDFGDAHYLDILNGGSRTGYYEPQLLGPVTLTHSIVR